MPADPNAVLFDAIAFAARAHRHQVRKDGATPYVSHVFRVAMTARHVFGVDDPRILAAAVLHDAIEDTTTDHDDLSDRFGSDVADWVAALTKDTRLPVAERETEYVRALQSAPWQVQVCKLADIYDNAGDCHTMPAGKQAHTLARCRHYLDGLRPHLRPEALAAFAVVEARVTVLATAGGG